MNIFWLLLLTGALVLAQSFLFSFFNMRGVSYTRRFSRTHATEGEKVELVEVIRNKKLLPVPWIRVESRISPNLRFGRASANEERTISAEAYHRSIFFLGPYSQVTRRHEVTCLKRGHYQAGTLSLTAGDLFAMGMGNKEMTLDCSLDVYPRLLSENELNAPSTRWQGELTVRRWIMPDPFLTAGIRDYRAGDPMRDIHWRASARMGGLQVKVRDHSADPRVMVVLNVQNSEEQWGDLMDYEQESIEQGIRIAATLCMRALHVGVEAGFASNGCLVGDRGTGKTVVVPPRRSLDQGDVLMTTMARLLIHRETNFPTFLEGLADVSGMDILVLSTYESDKIHAGMEKLRMRGNSVLFMPLERGRSHAKVG